MSNVRNLPLLWVGIGCQRGISTALIETAIAQVLQSNELTEVAIAGVATINSKATEAGLVQYCRDQRLPLRCFSTEQLSAVVVPNPSSVVATIGTPSVAEAAAILAASGVLRVPKQIFRKAGEVGAVTIAIAISTH